MKKKIVAVIAAVTMLFGAGAGSAVSVPQVQAASYSNLSAGKGAETKIVLVPGQTTEVVLPIIAREFVYNAEFAAVLPESAPFTVRDAQVYQDYEWTTSDYTYISTSQNTMLRFYVETKATAKIGEYQFQMRYTDHLTDGTVIEEGDREYLQSLTFTGVVLEEKLPAEMAISNLKIEDALKPGGVANVSFTVTNTGEIEAKGVRLSADYSAGLLAPEYTDYTRKLGDMKQGDSRVVSLRIRVLETVSQSVVLLPLEISYKNSDGESFLAEANNTLYLKIQLPEEEQEEKFENGTLLVNNVKQSPSMPKAGEKVTVSFYMENTGEKDYTDTKLYTSYVSNTGFEPVNAEPYQYIGTIKAGEKKAVSLTVIAGEEIPAGMNTLGISYTYRDGNGTAVTEGVDLYVLNVQKKEDTLGNSKPKLMVSEFTTSLEQIKSGEEFDFIFQVYNTHSETSAKNIKVTVTSEMFSVTKGSNSFFVQEIAPGSSEEITINLKASAAATTGSYPISIQMEYEYDGMPAAEANNSGVVVTEAKMLLIKENLRVSVENLYVGGWDTPYANQTTQLSFSIYNMGKSMLNNVYFTLEGDFEVANGSSYYYGTLQAGYPDYVEMDIIPLAAGDVSGTLTIHMEDSNGDEVTYTTDISAYVMEMGGGDSSWDDPDYITDIPAISPGMEEQAEPIMSLPVFVVVVVLLFFASLFVTRGVCLARHKKKLKNEE